MTRLVLLLRRSAFLALVPGTLLAVSASSVEPQAPQGGQAEDTRADIGRSVTVCASTGVRDKDYRFTATAVGGTGWYMPPMPRTMKPRLPGIPDVSCKGFWLAQDPRSGPTRLTITELGATPDSIVVNPFSPDRVTYTGTPSVTVTVDYRQGAMIRFFNPIPRAR